MLICTTKGKNTKPVEEDTEIDDEDDNTDDDEVVVRQIHKMK